MRLLLGRHLHTETPPGARKGSIFVRHVDGGSSNVVESELTALQNAVYDLAQYGIRFVASPSHADLLLFTGPLTLNMLGPVREAFAVMPEPKAIITVGDHADFGARHPPDDPISGNVARLLASSYATVDLPDEMRRAIVGHVPGDPPEPATIIRALLQEITRRRRRPLTREPTLVASGIQAGVRGLPGPPRRR
jgi:Ni,Fe-hydrogenase III small subunit